MDYFESIERLKEGLKGYSAEEEKLSTLYKTALDNAEKQYKDAEKQIEEQYYRDRNEVYADTARDERNALNAIAARGLGFSGEAAQAKLNSNILMSNRLGALTRDKNLKKSDLEINLSDTKQKLATEEADKLKDLLDRKNGLNADIAAIILDKENSEKQLEAEKEMQAAKLNAEKELQQAKLDAEMEMLKAELAAKYQASGGASTNGGNGGSGGLSGSTDSVGDIEGVEDGKETAGGYVPSITAKELARRVITSATGGNRIDSDKDAYLVNKYIIELSDVYGVDKDYLDELIFMLSAYGYEDISASERRVMVVSNDADAYYDDIYNQYYDKFVSYGNNEETSRYHAKRTALEKQIEYIYNNCRSVAEFRQCCDNLNIPNDKIIQFLNDIAAENKNGLLGGSGSANGTMATE